VGSFSWRHRQGEMGVVSALATVRLGVKSRIKFRGMNREAEA
jgi:hypothetical protein